MNSFPRFFQTSPHSVIRFDNDSSGKVLTRFGPTCTWPLTAELTAKTFPECPELTKEQADRILSNGVRFPRCEITANQASEILKGRKG